jgi:hypothetical protein
MLIDRALEIGQRIWWLEMTASMIYMLVIIAGGLPSAPRGFRLAGFFTSKLCT